MVISVTGRVNRSISVRGAVARTLGVIGRSRLFGQVALPYGYGVIRGVGSVTSTARATAKASGTVTGVASIVSVVAALFAGSGIISGVGSMTSSPGALGAGSGSLVGEGAVTSAVRATGAGQGAVSGVGDLVGTQAASAKASGIITGIGDFMSALRANAYAYATVGGVGGAVGACAAYGASYGSISGVGDLVGDADYTSGASESFVSPNFNNYVRRALPDGAGGYFVCGAFTSVTDSVGTYTRNRLCHLDADGLVTAWNPSAGAEVREMAWDGGTYIYCFGSFSSVSIGGQTRSYLCRVDVSTGATDASWNPSPNGAVQAVTFDGSGGVFVGGAFTTIASATRNRCAQLDSGGSATIFNPNANGTVFSLWHESGTLYVGGDYTSIGGQSRSRIASLVVATGSATSWNPGANGYVYRMLLDSGVCYICGGFTSAGGQTRSRFAAINSSGSSNSFNPNANGDGYGMFMDGTSVIATGAFTSIGGGSRSYAARLATSNGTADSWNPSCNSSAVCSDVRSSGRIVIAGNFTTVTTKLSGGAYMAACDP